MEQPQCDKITKLARRAWCSNNELECMIAFMEGRPFSLVCWTRVTYSIVYPQHVLVDGVMVNRFQPGATVDVDV